MSVAQNIVFYLMAAVMGNGVIRTVRQIGKPRVPVTPEFAAAVVVFQLLFLAGLVYVTR